MAMLTAAVDCFLVFVFCARAQLPLLNRLPAAAAVVLLCDV